MSCMKCPATVQRCMAIQLDFPSHTHHSIVTSRSSKSTSRVASATLWYSCSDSWSLFGKYAVVSDDAMQPRSTNGGSFNTIQCTRLTCPKRTPLQAVALQLMASAELAPKMWDDPVALHANADADVMDRAVRPARYLPRPRHKLEACDAHAIASCLLLQPSALHAACCLLRTWRCSMDRVSSQRSSDSCANDEDLLGTKSSKVNVCK